MEQPEVTAFIEKLKEVEKEMTNLMATITGTSTIEPLSISVGNAQTPEDIFSDITKHLERMY